MGAVSGRYSGSVRYRTAGRPRRPVDAFSAARARPATQGSARGAQGATAALDSSVLLQGHKTVAISHNGSVYRLQATKLGKLILTK